ncbi:MAG: hypothetical protein ACRDBO_05010 [Lachnospiraceae bacterium]
MDAGVYRAESIKVAEAAKVIENSQRDINIAFMNSNANIQKARDLLDNDPDWSFARGFEAAISWYKENL